MLEVTVVLAHSGEDDTRPLTIPKQFHTSWLKYWGEGCTVLGMSIDLSISLHACL